MKLSIEKHNPTIEERAHYSNGPVFFVVDSERNILSTHASESQALEYILERSK